MTSNGSVATSHPVTVITGGSDGIGLALAKRAAGRGETILLVARDPTKLETARTALGANTHTLSLDVSSPDAPARIDARLADIGCYCDVLIQSAAVGLAGHFVEHDPDAIDRLVTLNIAALTRLMRHVLPGMLARGRGGILNIASLGGYAPGPYHAAYYASKAYVISLTESLAHENRGRGVRIAVAAPGPVDTAFHARMQGETGLYLTLLPVPTAKTVARRIDRGFRWGLRVIVPGLRTKALMAAMRLTPHPISIPITGWLLWPRR